MNAPVVAFLLDATEYERGWGCRPDGVLAFLNESDADKFLDQIAQERRFATSVPDEYTSYSKMGYREVKPSVITDVKAQKEKNIDFRWYVRLSECLSK